MSSAHDQRLASADGRIATSRWTWPCLVYCLGALAWGAALLAPWVDVLVGNLWPMVQAAIGFVLIAALAWALGGVVWSSRNRRMPILVTSLALLLAAIPAGVLLGHTPDEGARTSGFHTRAAATTSDHTLRVLSANLEYGGAHPKDVMRAITATRADVVVLVELTAAELKRLDAEGLRQIMPHRTSPLIDSGSLGSMVLSRYPLETVDTGFPTDHYSLQMPTAAVHAPGGEVRVRAVHTYPPLLDGVGHWRPQLRALGDWQRSQGAARLIMAGDFNASRAHPAFRQLSEGLADTVAIATYPGKPTWPQHDVKPPFTQIDHILTRGFAVNDGGTIILGGTDHAAVWSALTY